MTNPIGDLWVKTHFYREGKYLCAKTYLVAAGDPMVFETRVDLEPIARFVGRYHAALHQKAIAGEPCIGADCLGGECVGEDCLDISGFFSSLGKTIKKIGKSKLLKGISRGVKSVVRSKALKAVAGVAAVVYPPVGAPALAAMAAASATLDRVDAARRDVKAVAAVVKAKAKVRVAVKAGVKLPTASPQVKAAAKTLAKSKVVLTPKVRANMLARKKDADLARAQLARVSETARTHPDAETRAQAQKAARVVSIVQGYRTKLKQIAGKAQTSATSGLVIMADGRIVTGKKWLTRGAGKAMLVEPDGTITRGQFEAVVGGCYGCGRLY